MDDRSRSFHRFLLHHITTALAAAAMSLFAVPALFAACDPNQPAGVRLERGALLPDMRLEMKFHHNCISQFHWAFRDQGNIVVIGSSPSPIVQPLYYGCMSGPVDVLAEWSPALADRTTMSIAPIDYVHRLQGTGSPVTTDNQRLAVVELETEVESPQTGYLEVWFHPARGPARKLTPDDYHVFNTTLRWQEAENGTVYARMRTCVNTAAEVFREAVIAVMLGCRTCSEGCAPECVAHPIQTSTGNMTFSDVDALPSVPFLPLKRTYDSGNILQGVFGRGWTSFFDAQVSPNAMDGDPKAFVAVATESGQEYLFRRVGGAYQQIAPAPGTAPTTLTGGSGSWTHTDADGQFVRTYTGNHITGYLDKRSGRAVTIERNASSPGQPTRVADSWGAWAWTITTNTLGRISRIEPEGRPDLAWTYTYAGDYADLQTVTSPAGQWRRYGYTLATFATVLTEVRDPQDRIIESHAYNGFRAATSVGPGEDLASVQYAQPGREAGEWKTVYTWTSGKSETHYQRQVGSELRTVEISGGCPSCSASGDGVWVYEPVRGNPLRAQDARGYVTESTYDNEGRLLTRTTNLQGQLGLDPEDLAAFELVGTSASVTTTYTYDATWRTKPATITTASVRTTPGSRVESFTYHPTTGEIVQHRVTGYTGLSPIRSETRTTTNAFYNGTEGAAFTPGGNFQSSWLTLPQPVARRKSTDGPRTDVVDVTRQVYYPFDSSVPATLRGQLAAIQNALGHITRFESYDLFGNVTRVVDPNGVATEMTYDGLGRLLTSTLKGIPGCNTTADPLCATDLVTTRTYFGAGPLATETRPEGAVTRYEYDSEARVSAITRGPSTTDQRERIETDYDPISGKKSAERIRAFEGGVWVTKKSESFTYDDDSQLTAVTHADNTSVAYTYDAAGQVLTVRDENHASPNTFHTYDSGRRLTRVNQTLGTGTISTLYAYDRNGNLTSVTDPNGNVTTYEYDDFGQLLQQTSPVSGLTTYTYNLGGLLTSSTDANGAVTTRHYDALGRVFYATSVRGGQSENVSWGYDSWAGLGRLASMSDPSGFTAWYYTRAGQMRVEQRNIEGTLYTTQQYRFDKNGNPTVITYPSGRAFTYTYDYADRPVSITTPGATIVTSAAYLPFGPLRELVYANGSVKTMTYDTRYQVETNRWQNGTTTLASYEYDHDPAGNITRMDDLLSAGFNRQFGYDDLHRLTTTVSGSMLWGTRPYTYDAMGNIKSTATGIPFTHQGTTPKIATFNEGAGPTAVTYDPAGNELTAGAVTSTISPRNSIATISNATFDYTFRYNGQGVRTLTEESPKPPTGTTTKRYHFYTPDLRFLGRVDYTVTAGTQTLLRRIEPIWLAGIPVAQIDYNDLATLRYTFTDHLGAPILQTSTTGAVIWQVDYEPYGRIWRIRAGTLSAQPLRLPGQEVATDREYYNVFRWYRGGWGRYTQVDPLQLGGGLHLYQYGDGNPLVNEDPLGLVTVRNEIEDHYYGDIDAWLSACAAVRAGGECGTVGAFVDCECSQGDNCWQARATLVRTGDVYIYNGDFRNLPVRPADPRIRTTADAIVHAYTEHIHPATRAAVAILAAVEGITHTSEEECTRDCRTATRAALTAFSAEVRRTQQSENRRARRR